MLSFFKRVATAARPIQPIPGFPIRDVASIVVSAPAIPVHDMTLRAAVAIAANACDIRQIDPAATDYDSYSVDRLQQMKARLKSMGKTKTSWQVMRQDERSQRMQVSTYEFSEMLIQIEEAIEKKEAKNAR